MTHIGLLEAARKALEAERALEAHRKEAASAARIAQLRVKITEVLGVTSEDVFALWFEGAYAITLDGLRFALSQRGDLVVWAFDDEEDFRWYWSPIETLSDLARRCFEEPREES